MAKDTHMNALKEILYGAGISFALGMVGYVLMFFFKLIAARHFGPEDFGLYEMAVTIFGVAVVFGDFGISAGIQRYIPYYLEKKKYGLLKGYMKFIIHVPLIFSTLLGISIYIFSNNISGFFGFGDHFGFLLRIISIGVPLRVLNGIFAHVLFSNKKAFQATLGYNVIERVVLVIGILIIAYFNLSLVYLVIITVISLISSLLITSFYAYGVRNKSNYKPKHDVKDWVKFSAPLIFTAVLAYILNWTDNFVIGRFLDSSSLGIYGVSYSMANYLTFFSGVFATLFLPVMTSLYIKDKEIFSKTFNQVTKWIFIGTIFMGAAIIYFSKEILIILFGSDYGSGYLSLSILAGFFIIASVFSMNRSIILIQKNTSFLFYNYLFLSLFNLGLNLLLIGRYGINGVAFASGLSYLLIKLLEYIKCRKNLNLGRMLFSLMKIILTGIAGVVIIKLIFTILFNHIALYEIIKLIIALGLYSISFVLITFGFKIFNEEDFKLMLVIEKRSGINLGFIKKILRRIV
jgi:O-antigen/teichoic acid export membrane protein